MNKKFKKFKKILKIQIKASTSLQNSSKTNKNPSYFIKLNMKNYKKNFHQPSKKKKIQHTASVTIT